MISAIAPKNVFTEVNSTTLDVRSSGISNTEQLLLCALANSFVFDWLLRHRVSSTLNMFYVYQCPMPRLRLADAGAPEILHLAAHLTCTSPDFADLGQGAPGTPWPSEGAIDPAEHALLRAELDARIAHLYGLDEAELRHVLATFPVVGEGVKAGVVEWFGRVGRVFGPGI
ncbi:MAG: hypothetical protein SF066_05440 [Thermoanaerobaculia bacterium]|nr:hypothetical protein [Thermoanaerobaculia bacterium]